MHRWFFQRKRDAESRSSILPALYRYFAPMRLHNPVSNRKSKTNPARIAPPCGIGAIEPLEYMGKIFGWNS
jgi:hypothetical protein